MHAAEREAPYDANRLIYIQDLSCTYLAHHELESITIITLLLMLSWQAQENSQHSAELQYRSHLRLQAHTSCGANSRPSFFLYQSMMRPTKGEMRLAPASAQAAACTYQIPGGFLVVAHVCLRTSSTKHNSHTASVKLIWKVNEARLLGEEDRVVLSEH